MKRLENVIRTYDWGSPTVIPHLLGHQPTGEPQAELWMGAHPAGPSTVRNDCGIATRLDHAIAADPAGILGAEVAERFDQQLPFLMKILAADKPLSLQVHPTKEQAQTGYQRELRLAADPDRVPRYLDANHKPEMVMALSEFRALSGLRPLAASATFLADTGIPSMQRWACHLGAAPASEQVEVLRKVIESILDGPDIGVDVQRLIEVCRARVAEGRAHEHDRVVALLGSYYPADPGVIVACLMNVVTLQPGQAMFVDAGVVHSYLDGVAVEIMACSDNVLRAGLTSKLVDVVEMLSVLDTNPAPPHMLSPTIDDRTWRWEGPAAECALARVHSTAVPVTLKGGGPRIVLVLDGEVTFTSSVDGTGGPEEMTVGQGQSILLTGADTHVSLHGDGTVMMGYVPGA